MLEKSICFLAQKSKKDAYCEFEAFTGFITKDDKREVVLEAALKRERQRWRWWQEEREQKDRKKSSSSQFRHSIWNLINILNFCSKKTLNIVNTLLHIFLVCNRIGATIQVQSSMTGVSQHWFVIVAEILSESSA